MIMLPKKLDRQFLLAQRKRGRQERMGSIDKILFETEKRKTERILKQDSYAEKVKKREEELTQVAKIPKFSDFSSVSSEASDDYYLQKWQMKKLSLLKWSLYPLSD